MNGSTPATSLGSNEQPMTYHIIRANWQNHESALRAVREAVFITEQHVPEALEWDEFDADSIHFLAQDEQENAVGCIRLLPSGQISRLCVLEGLRSHGIGGRLLQLAEDEARSQGMTEVFLHAQTQACHFYEAAGFTVNGGIFLEADIPHRQMTKELHP